MSKKLIMMMGLPRSGKSTAAKEYNVPIVNPDSIRLALHGQAWVAESEPVVWLIAEYMVRALFLAGHDTVVLDATNTTNLRRDAWKSPRWIRMLHIVETSIETCMERAAASGFPGEVIQRMHRNWEWPDEADFAHVRTTYGEDE